MSTGVCGEIYNNEECKIQDKTHFDVLIYLDIAAMLFAMIMLIVMGKWLWTWWKDGAQMAQPEPEQEEEPDSERVRLLRDEVQHLRTELNAHMADCQRLQGALDDRVADYDQLLQTHKDYKAEHGPQAAQQTARTVVQNPIYMDQGSSFWHSSYYCARSFVADREIYKIDSCRRCSPNMGASNNHPRGADRAATPPRPWRIGELADARARGEIDG